MLVRARAARARRHACKLSRVLSASSDTQHVHDVGQYHVQLELASCCITRAARALKSLSPAVGRIMNVPTASPSITADDRRPGHPAAGPLRPIFVCCCMPRVASSSHRPMATVRLGLRRLIIVCMQVRTCVCLRTPMPNMHVECTQLTYATHPVTLRVNELYPISISPS